MTAVQSLTALQSRRLLSLNVMPKETLRMTVQPTGHGPIK